MPIVAFLCHALSPDIYRVSVKSRELKSIFLRILIYFRCSTVDVDHFRSGIFQLRIMFELTTSLSQYKAWTIFHIFADVL